MRNNRRGERRSGGIPLTSTDMRGGGERGRGKNKESKVDITTRTVVIKMPCS